MERALCDAREYVDHWVVSLFLRHLTVPEDPGAVREELAVEEGVHHPQLQHNVDEAEQLAAPVP